MISASSSEEKDAWKADIAKILLGLGKDPNAESQSLAPKSRGLFSSMKLPSWRSPDMGLPDAEVPDMPDVELPDVEAPDIDIPDVDIKVPDVDLPDVKVPDMDGTLPDVGLPDVDVPDVPDLGVDDEAEAIGEVIRRMTVSQAGKDAPAEIIREGEMSKTGGAWKSWKTRWFVMYAKSIAYLDKKDGKVKGGILFEDATMVSTLRIGRGCCACAFFRSLA